MIRLLAVPLAALSFHAVVQPLSPPVRTLLTGNVWHKGCPVGLSDLRVLTVTHWGFDGRTHTGQLVVNRKDARPLAGVFHELYDLRFPIRDMRLRVGLRAEPADTTSAAPSSAGRQCRRRASAAPAPGSWSEHAYGEAVDLNPVENPYVGCGMSRNPASRPYFDRSRLRPGMITPAVVAAFRSIGWGWGGSWAGSTKDYMHFSASGH